MRYDRLHWQPCYGKLIERSRPILNQVQMSDKSSRGRPAIDMHGSVCGQLTVLGRQGFVQGRLAAWRVRCTCGFVFIAAGAHLRNGKVWRCRGCANRAQSEARKGHGETGTYLYRAWATIRQAARTSNGTRTLTGRGAPIWPAWDRSYPRFAADIRATIGDRPSAHSTLALLPGMHEYKPGAVYWSGRADWMHGPGTKSRYHIRPERQIKCPCPG